MEQAISAIAAGDLNSVSLLMLFIIGLLTKRFVPWWVHEDVLDRLYEYEEATPALIDEFKELIRTVKSSPHYTNAPQEEALLVRHQQLTRVTRHRRKKRKAG